MTSCHCWHFHLKYLTAVNKFNVTCLYCVSVNDTTPTSRLQFTENSHQANKLCEFTDTIDQQSNVSWYDVYAKPSVISVKITDASKKSSSQATTVQLCRCQRDTKCVSSGVYSPCIFCQYQNVQVIYINVNEVVNAKWKDEESKL